MAHAKGITCFVLKYRLAHCVTTDPVASGAKWGKLVRFCQSCNNTAFALPMEEQPLHGWRNMLKNTTSRLIAWAYYGFSAGGTVATDRSFVTRENWPDFAAPIYPLLPNGDRPGRSTDAPPLLFCASDDGLGLHLTASNCTTNGWRPTTMQNCTCTARGNHGLACAYKTFQPIRIERFGDWLWCNRVYWKENPEPRFGRVKKRIHQWPTTKSFRTGYYCPRVATKPKVSVGAFLHGLASVAAIMKAISAMEQNFSNARIGKNFPSHCCFPRSARRILFGLPHQSIVISNLSR